MIQPHIRAVAGHFGRIPRRVLWTHLGRDEMTELKVLTKEVGSAFVAGVKSGAISSRIPDRTNAADPLLLRGLTAQKYLDLCAVCIRAICPAETRLTRDIYRGWADGRHGGLLSLRPHSAQAFSTWFYGSERQGSHPFEFFRDHMSLMVHSPTPTSTAMWLRLLDLNRHISADLIVSALALHSAGVPVCVVEAELHAVFAAGDDYVGVAEDAIAEYGTPQWPPDSGILNTFTQSVLLSELSGFPMALAAIEWFPGSTVPIRDNGD